jgi:hypothetical protein
MKERLRPDLTWQLKEARQLLELGEVQEALVLAMDILRRELDQLREALEAMRKNLPPDEAAATAPEDHPQREFSWPESPSRHLH